MQVFTIVVVDPYMSVLRQDLDLQRHMSWIANIIYCGFPTSDIIQRQITGVISHE
jgi:hypothetical protein